MRRALCVCAAVCVLMGAGFVSLALANGAVKDDVPAIMVSPHVIVLDKAAGVTVHTNIPAGSVIRASVALNGVAPRAVWADDCGHLAARFSIASLELDPGRVALVLTGAYVSGGATFSAQEIVRVK